MPIVPSPGQVRVPGHPVGRDRVVGPHHTEERGGDHQSTGGAAARRGRERTEVEGVVQDPGVEPVGPGGGCLEEPRVQPDLVELGGPETEDVRGPRVCLAGRLGAIGAEADEGLQQLGASVGEPGMGEPVELERLSVPWPGLAFGRREQDQHRDSVGGLEHAVLPGRRGASSDPPTRAASLGWVVHWRAVGAP